MATNIQERISLKTASRYTIGQRYYSFAEIETVCCERTRLLVCVLEGKF